MDFGWFPPFFKVTSWILVGSPGFLCGFCFFLVFSFMVSYMIWKASVCRVEKTPKHTCLLGMYQGATIQSRPASTTNCRFLLFAKSFANYGNWLGILLSRKPSWTPELGPEQWWLATPEVMFLLCPLLGLKTIFVHDLTETGLWQLCTTVGTPFQICCSELTILIWQLDPFVLSVSSLPCKPLIVKCHFQHHNHPWS